MSYNTIRRPGSKTDKERKACMSNRPIDVHEGTPHYSHRGTPPRKKTIRRLTRQLKMGINCTAKRILRDDGSLVHPTKGKRNW